MYKNILFNSYFSHLNEALPNAHLQLIGLALKDMGALTQAAIALYYANEKNEGMGEILTQTKSTISWGGVYKDVIAVVYKL